MPHESAQIPLDTGMWLDDLGPPAAATVANASLEDSLTILTHAHSSAFDGADDDVHALFPMLSEASFDYDDAVKPPPNFPDDLSPILTAMPEPSVPKTEREATHTVNKLQSRRRSSTTPTPAQAVTPLTSVGMAIPFPHQDLTSGSTPTATRRRRRLRSTSLSAMRTQWTEHEQNSFFLVFKPKWSIDTPTPEQFAMLLLERFDVVSEKLKNSTHKTSHDVEAFYNTIVQAITDLLDVVAPHDIDLLNPDEIRIALWCWHKLQGDDQKRQDMDQVEGYSMEQKKPLALELLQSIVRSRRQMLKAKAMNHTTGTVDTMVPAGLNEAEEMASLEGLLREALEHSSLPSYLYQLAPVEANTASVVHHPLVRRKSQNSTSSTPTAGQKRQRSESDGHDAFPNGTPLRSRESADIGSSESSSLGSSFVTPPAKNPTKRMKIDPQNQTPPQSSRKKIYIKLRMVPRDTQTKDVVERCGCNPKVELKLSSTKKVSDVLDHMTKKWAKVQSLVDKQATLHFFQKDSSVTSPNVPSVTASSQSAKSWSRRNHDVTCLDIWKHSGKMKNDEYIAEVSYQWRVDDALEDDPTQLFDLLQHDMTKKHLAFDHGGSSSKDNSPFASPLNLNDVLARHDQEHDVAPVQPLGKTQSLQAFSETVAFDTKPFAATEGIDEQLSLASLPDDALSELIEYSPNSQRMRRRITPVLVPTNECQL